MIFFKKTNKFTEVYCKFTEIWFVATQLHVPLGVIAFFVDLLFNVYTYLTQ